MATVLITGGTGMIGKAITKDLLEKKYEVIVLTRKVPLEQPVAGLSYAQWNIEQPSIDAEAMRNADHIIHLAGANVAEKRWTKKRKQEIIDSRVKSGELLVKALKEIPNKIKSVISASAIGWYGADGEKPGKNEFVETDPSSNDFLGQTCKLWEESIEPVAALGKRLVKFRIGIVLCNEGGVLEELSKPLKFGIAAILGSGKQVMSWIHIDDIVRLFINAIENENLQGVYNAVAPQPVPGKELVMQLAKSRKRFYIPVHVPSFALKIALGGLSIEVLKSATVSAEKIQQAGFVFQYPDIKSLEQFFKA